jgi:uncharacterized protein
MPAGMMPAGFRNAMPFGIMPDGMNDNPRNPFRFGALALDEAFTDREAELRTVVADARNGQDVVVFAPRRYGKSSLVWRAAQELLAGGALVAQVDLMTTPTKLKLAEKLARTIHDDLATPLFRARERLRVFSGLRIAPTVTVEPETGALSFSFSAGRPAEDVDAVLEELFALPARLAADRRKTVVVVLDEFQEVVDIDPRLPRAMRAAFQQQPEVCHVYLGSKRHMMQRIFSDDQEPFWRSAKPLELGPIDPAAFAPYLRERFAATGRELAPDVADRLLDVTRGHPYATQELAYFLWERGGADLDAALTEVVRSEHAHFSLIWDRAATAQRVVLQALAAEQPARPLTTDYQRRHDLPSTPTVQKAVAALVRNELVARVAPGTYAISEPFLAEWIRREES